MARVLNVHMGQEFGLANQILMLLVCMAIVLLSVSAGIMWWKRRPGRSLGVPPLPADRSVLRGVLAILMIGGVLFPGGFKFRNEHHLCSGSRRGECRGNDGS